MKIWLDDERLEEYFELVHKHMSMEGYNGVMSNVAPCYKNTYEEISDDDP